MRNPLTLIGVLGLAVLAGCTVKTTEAPSLSGPSTFATALILSAEPSSVLQDGPSNPFAQSIIKVTARDAQGRPIENLLLQAQIFVGGVAMDFGTILPASKQLRTDSGGGTQFYYYAPPKPADSTGTGTLVTIAITPIGPTTSSSGTKIPGDARSDLSRTVDIRVLPPGVILPPNGAPVAAFVVSPPTIPVGVTATFDASSSTDEGVPCGSRCTYAWNFGDGTSGTGITTTKIYRAAGAYTVTLIVTDERGGSSAPATKSVTISAPVLPDAQFDFSPSPASVGQTIFFNASKSTAATDRKLVSYDWDFGKGTTGSGVTVTKVYDTVGTYTVTLKVTDDIGAAKTNAQSVVVGSTNVSFTVSPTSPFVNGTAFFDASASRMTSPIVEYRYTWGDNTPDTVTSSTSATHTFTSKATFVVRLTVTDSEGRKASATINVSTQS